VPKSGDSLERLGELASWLKNSLGKDTPLHLLRFHPDYKLTTIPSTSIETMEQAYVTAKNAGLSYVYIGNVPGHPSENTYCPNCNEMVIKRYGFEITRWNLTKDMRCPVCGQDIPIKGKLHASGVGYPYALF
jgi:pyruvate formate lyase activating enzyme